MYAIRVTGKQRRADTGNQTLFVRLDFSFYDLLLAIGAYVSDLYWAHTGIIYSFPESLTKEDYSLINQSIQEYILHSVQDSSIQYMHRGFIEKFGRFIYSDSLDIAGYEDIETLKSFENDLNDVSNSKAIVYFRCKDAIYWDLYSSNFNVIKLIDDAFGFTETFNIGA